MVKEKASEKTSIELGYNLSTSKISAKVEIPNISKKISAVANYINRSWIWAWQVHHWASRDGKRGLPESSSLAPTGSELKIAGKYKLAVEKLTGFLTTYLIVAQEYASGFEPRKLSEDTLKKQIRGETKELLNRYDSDIKQIDRAYRAALDEYNKFKSDHNLKADPKASPTIYKATSALLMLGAAEGVLNSFLLSEVSAGGNVGGFAYAIMFSFFNVLVGLASGVFAWRHIYWQRGIKRVFAIFLAIAFSVFAFLLNWGMAHYREVAEKSLANASSIEDEFYVLGNVPLDQVANNMFAGIGLSTLPAVALLLIGIAISGYSSLEGATKLFDRIPGFASLWREKNTKLKKRDELWRLLGTDLKRRFDRYLYLFEFDKTLHHFFKKEMDSAKILVTGSTEQADNIGRGIRLWAEGWIETYRTNNEVKRVSIRKKLQERELNGRDTKVIDPGPPPAYFEQPVTFGNEYELPSNADCLDQINYSLNVINNNSNVLEELTNWLLEKKHSIYETIDSRALEPDVTPSVPAEDLLHSLRAEFKSV
ncbi:MAG: hypothetical protein AAF720_06095 [Pseudomonadota bacterium]